MNFIKVKLGLNSGAQNEIQQYFKANGCAVIQTSDGLCVATSEDESQIRRDLDLKKIGEGASLERISPEDEQAPDVLAFIEENAPPRH